MDFNAIITSIKTSLTQKYMSFSGRADRAEFWYFALFVTVISGALAGTAHATGIAAFQWAGQIFTFATLLPYIGVTVRRLHDIGKSGWWALLPLVPLIGIFALIYFLAKKSQVGPNQYGA